MFLLIIGSGCGLKFCYVRGRWVHRDPTYCDFALAWIVGRQMDPVRRPENLDCGSGANYVDVTLKIVVLSAPGTIMAFRPNHLHGTSKSYGAVNRGLAITFSRRVTDAYRDLDATGKAKFQVESGAGSGDASGNDDGILR